MGRIILPTHWSLQRITISTKDGGDLRGIVQGKSEHLKD